MIPTLALFIICNCVGVSGNGTTHELQFITAITPSISSTIVELDSEPFLGTCITKTIPTMCEEKKNHDQKKNHSDYYKSIKDWIWREQDNQQHLQSQIMEHFNHTKGNHTLHMVCKCELKDNVTQKGSITFSYDEEDFMSLNLKNGTWTAADDKAESFLKRWESAEREANHWKHLNNNNSNYCIQTLKMFLERKANHLLQYIKSSNDSMSWELDCEQLQTWCLNITKIIPKTEFDWRIPTIIAAVVLICIFAASFKLARVFNCGPVGRIKTCICQRTEKGDIPLKDFITVPVEPPYED